MDTKTLIAVVALCATLIGGTFGASRVLATKDYTKDYVEGSLQQVAFTIDQLNTKITNTQQAVSLSGLVNSIRAKINGLETDKYRLRALIRKYPTDTGLKDELTDNAAALSQAQKDLSAAEAKLAGLK